MCAYGVQGVGEGLDVDGQGLRKGRTREHLAGSQRLTNHTAAFAAHDLTPIQRRGQPHPAAARQLPLLLHAILFVL